MSTGTAVRRAENEGRRHASRNSRSGLGGLPLVVYVAILLLVPLLGVGLLSYQEVRRNSDAADAARRIESAIGTQSAAINVVAPLQVERTALQGLARIDLLGVDRDLALAFIGVNFDEIRARNQADFDGALDALVVAIDAEPHDGLHGAGDRLVDLRDQLQRQRIASDQRKATPPTIDAVMLEISDFLDVVIEHTRQVVTDEQTGGGDGLRLTRELEIVADVSRTAGVEASLAFDAVLTGGGVPQTELLAALIRHEDALADTDDLTSADATAIREQHDTLTPLPAELFALDGSEPGRLMQEPDLLGVSVGALLERVDYLQAVRRFGLTETAKVSEFAGELADDAEERTRLTVLGLIMIGLVSIVFGAFVIRSFARPLTRLRLEAERISRGVLRPRALQPTGPVDVRRVTAAVNEMSGTLTLVDEHMKALAAGDVRAGGSLRELPGEVGASMRESVELVTELTSRLQSSEARLVEQARHDSLTGLPNRFAVLEHLDQMLASSGPAERCGVMFIDLDGFKSVNDTHGHAVGDTVLRLVARRLRELTRDRDFVARLGGDEFIVVAVDHAGPEVLISLGERIIGEIEQPYSVGDQLFTISASVGVATVEDGDDSMRAIERADAAVYQAKQRGRRRVEMFDADLQSSIEHQSSLELALRQALRDNELTLFLQPIATVETGAVAGAEALVRWNRPGVGLLPPDDFIPIAERSGLIFDLERWVLVESCRQAAAWRHRDPACVFRIAVNISGRHLIEGDLLGDVTEALSVAGADPHMLELELTESQLLDDVPRASRLLNQLRGLGITIAIDDFGTGYSSMTYLQKLPVDAVKIDRSFISRATENGFDSTIVDAIVTIGTALALDVVAEGVETVDQLAYVARKGVTRAQGYLLARPAPATEATDLMFAGPMIDVDELVPARRAARHQHA